MARPKNPFPPLCLHTRSGLWYYRIDGKPRYLGRDKATAEAQRVCELKMPGAPPSPQLPPVGGYTVLECLNEYLKQKVPKMEPRDRRRNQLAVQIVLEGWGHLPIERFRLREAEALASKLAALPRVAKIGGERDPAAGPISSNYCRKLLGSVCQAWRWCMTRDMVSADSCAKVCLILRQFKSDGDSSPETVPVPPESFRAALPHMRPEVAAMAQVQLITGMRTGELLRMSSDEIDRSKEVWVYRPRRHKNAGRGKRRSIFLDAECQRLLAPYLDRSPCFPLTLTAYAHSIRRACRKSGVPYFRPYQMRHASATEAERDAGEAAAIALLGHHGKRLLKRYTGHKDG